MPRRPGDTNPEPPGGRAAERLREFIDQRFPGGLPLPKGAEKKKKEAEENSNAEQKGSAEEAPEQESEEHGEHKTP